MTTQRTACTRTLAGLSLALLGCGGGGVGGQRDDAAAEGVSRVVEHSIRIERVEPYDETLPAAEGVPALFRVERRREGVGNCDPLLVDPERGPELRLMVSRTTSRTTQRGDTTFVVHSGYGDYAVEPPSAYGLSLDERLRVDCGRNVLLGRVPAGR